MAFYTTRGQMFTLDAGTAGWNQVLARVRQNAPYVPQPCPAWWGREAPQWTQTGEEPPFEHVTSAASQA